MNERRRKQIRSWLLETIDNTKAPPTYPSHNDFKQEWLFEVADVATELARQHQPNGGGNHAR